LAGTVPYLSPALKHFLILCQNNSNEKCEFIETDLFKNDIFSLGVTLYEALTKNDVKLLNSNISLQKGIYDTLHSTTIPLAMK